MKCGKRVRAQLLGRFRLEIPAGEQTILVVQKTINNAENPLVMGDQDEGAILLRVPVVAEDPRFAARFGRSSHLPEASPCLLAKTVYNVYLSSQRCRRVEKRR